ncbi:hypothetical protein [Rhodomicrobium sp.]|uniref:hypothetical protein n=1 Tax=Rhodomicrobium sp. TaxID=2720632 RepID=UPI0039E6310B
MDKNGKNVRDDLRRRLDEIKRISDEVHGTLNAISVISRMEDALEDISRLEELSTKYKPHEWARSPFSIISYYSVIYVTCLEWHARSRLADLFEYQPSSLADDDLKKGLGTEKIVGLITNKAAIPHFVAFSRNISNAGSYLETFARIFSALSIPNDPRKIIANIRPRKLADLTFSEATASGVDYLTGIYDFRNELVHQIDISQIGPTALRYDWDCTNARAYGEFVLSAIKAIEAEITASSPPDFPNRLDDDGYPINVEDLIDEKICELEAEIASRMEGFRTVLDVSKKAFAAEIELIETAEELNIIRWFDYRTPCRRALKRGRLQYLEALRSNLDY